MIKYDIFWGAHKELCITTKNIKCNILLKNNGEYTMVGKVDASGEEGRVRYGTVGEWDPVD